MKMKPHTLHQHKSNQHRKRHFPQSSVRLLSAGQIAGPQRKRHRHKQVIDNRIQIVIAAKRRHQDLHKHQHRHYFTGGRYFPPAQTQDCQQDRHDQKQDRRIVHTAVPIILEGKYAPPPVQTEQYQKYSRIENLTQNCQQRNFCKKSALHRKQNPAACHARSRKEQPESSCDIIPKHPRQHRCWLIVCRLLRHGKHRAHHGRIRACSVSKTDRSQGHDESGRIPQHTPQGVPQRPTPFLLSAVQECPVPHRHDKGRLDHIGHPHRHIDAKTDSGHYIVSPRTSFPPAAARQCFVLLIPGVTLQDSLIQQQYPCRHQQIGQIIVQDRRRAPA